jgi:hypothetical protein
MFALQQFPIERHQEDFHVRASSVQLPTYQNQADAEALAPRQELKRQMRQKSTQFARALPKESRGFAGLKTDRSRALEAAKEHVQEFYSAHINDKDNLALSGVSAQWARQAGLDPEMTGRRASFASIARQDEDLVTLVRADQSGVGSKMNDESRTVLAGVLDTLKFGAESMKLSAVENAKLGRRALPLSLDNARFATFLRNQESQLQAVVECCRNPHGSEARLQRILTQLANDYLAVNNRKPDSMLVEIAEFNGGTQQKTYDCTGNQEVAGLKIHRNLLTGSLANYQNRLARFRDQPEAKQRASMILQTVIGAMTDLEEWIVAGGRHVVPGSQASQASMLGTRAEHEYGGSPALGDTVEDSRFGPSQRKARLFAVAQLPQIAGQYQNKHGVPLVDDRNLQQWIGSGAKFADDIRIMQNPGSRLRIAQIDSTATALLNTETFRR